VFNFVTISYHESVESVGTKTSSILLGITDRRRLLISVASLTQLDLILPDKFHFNFCEVPAGRQTTSEADNSER
jgi:hypothetical protein